jgi:hypothetical protein
MDAEDSNESLMEEEYRLGSSDHPDPKASNKKGKKESLIGLNATKPNNRTKSDQESNKKLKDKKGNDIEEEKQ